VLFSQPQVAAFLNSHFECAWQSLRPVPQVQIDFGNGTVLHRTLVGNIATWFCTGDGLALDVLPGLCDAPTFLERARRAVDLAHRFVDPRSSFAELRTEWFAQAMAGEQQWQQYELLSLTLPDLSKSGVERPVRRALRGGRVVDADPVAPRSPRDLQFMSKMAVEQPIRTGIAAPPDPRTALQIDSFEAATIRSAQAVRTLAAAGRPVRPDELTKTLFLQVLHVPLDDPFLGLAPEVLGGEGGRHQNGTGAVRHR